MHVVNLAHDPLGPQHSGGDHGLGSRTGAAVEKVLRRLEMCRYDGDSWCGARGHCRKEGRTAALTVCYAHRTWMIQLN